MTDRAATTSKESPAPWPPESAGAHIVTRVPVAREHEEVASVCERIATEAPDVFDAVYVVDADRRFLGAARIPDIYRAPPRRTMGEVMERGYPRTGLHRDQEDLPLRALTQRATSVAVVDEGGRLVGAVPALSLLTILRQEHVEDLQRLAGIQRERMHDLSALEAPPLRRARHRLPWLLVGLAGSMLAAMVVSRFERVLEEQLAVAFFVPAIVYLADAIGTQTEAIVVRGLSLNRLSLRHLLSGELRTGLLMGVVLGAISLPLVALTFGDVWLAASVAMSILVAGGAATTIGLLLPWLFQRMGGDPAFGSGPVATIVQDVLSLLVYFFIATVVFG